MRCHDKGGAVIKLTIFITFVNNRTCIICTQLLLYNYGEETNGNWYFKRYTKKRGPGRSKQQELTLWTSMTRYAKFETKNDISDYYFSMRPTCYIHNYDNSMFE